MSSGANVANLGYVLNQPPLNRVLFGDSLVSQLKEIFGRCDRNANGLLAVPELKAAFDMYGIPCADRTVQTIVQKFDQTNKGSLNFTEFCNCFLAILTSNGLNTGGFFFK